MLLVWPTLLTLLKSEIPFAMYIQFSCHFSGNSTSGSFPNYPTPASTPRAIRCVLQPLRSQKERPCLICHCKSETQQVAFGDMYWMSTDIHVSVPLKLQKERPRILVLQVTLSLHFPHQRILLNEHECPEAKFKMMYLFSISFPYKFPTPPASSGPVFNI